MIPKDKLKCYTGKRNDKSTYVHCVDKTKDKQSKTTSPSPVKKKKLKIKNKPVQKPMPNRTVGANVSAMSASASNSSPLYGGVGLRPEISKLVQDFARPSFKHYAEKAYKEIGEARKNVKFGSQVYYKSGKKKGKPRFFQMTPRDMKDERRWEKEIFEKMAKKYSLPMDWDIKYRTKGGGEASLVSEERNMVANELSSWVETYPNAKNPYR